MMKRCYHNWLKFEVANNSGYGWCTNCGAFSGFGTYSLGYNIPKYYQEMWPLSETESSLLKAGDEIQVLREYRMRTGFGLKEAKEALARHRSQDRDFQETAKETGS